MHEFLSMFLLRVTVMNGVCDDSGSLLVSVSESVMSVSCVAADVLRECCVVCVCVE